MVSLLISIIILLAILNVFGGGKIFKKVKFPSVLKWRGNWAARLGIFVLRTIYFLLAISGRTMIVAGSKAAGTAFKALKAASPI